MAPRLLRTGIALALACGLMVPTGALAASEDEARENATNILKPASGYGAGLRCGKTSTLVIDDENPNIVAGGSKLNVNDIITPKKGKVGFDGAPSYFDAGKLYLWLPFSAVGKEITVKLKRYNEDGSLKPVEDLSATPGDSSGSGHGKRWISYELTDEFKTENASLFSKYYDGESIKNLIASLESYVGTDGLPAPYEANKDAKLTNPDALLYQSAKLGDDGKPLDEYYPTEAVHDHKVLPTDFEDGTGDVAFSVGDVPGGLVPVSGGIKLVLPDGSETTCPDDAYSPEKGDVVVFAGPVRGGQKVRLVIDALVTDAALGTDIGNVAFAYGTDPSGTETTVLTGDPSGTPGWRFEGIDGLEQAASEGTAFRSESKVTYPEGYDGQVRPNPAGDGDTKLKMRRLAKTGDEVPLALPLGLAMLAASALAVIALAARTNRRARG